MKNNKLKEHFITEPISIPAKQARHQLGDLLDNARFAHKSYLITKQKKPAGVLIGINEYEDMVDMIDTMAEQLDPKFQASLIAGKKEIEAGQGVSEDELDNIFKAQMKQ